MHKDRLLILANYLDAIPEDKFNMSIWYNYGDDCGCAIGHACKIPEFKEIGLHQILFGTPSYNNKYGFACIKEFFNISFELAVYLFDNESYENVDRITPKIVSKRIREFVEGK